MDDSLEQLLLETFVPTFIRYDDDGCPGPSTTGLPATDSNLVVCRIFLIPQQYTLGSNLTSVQQFPTVIVPDTGLTTGLAWYENLMVIYGALLYGRDCGLTSHTADVEGFTVTLKYVGPDMEGGWRYDTDMNNWMGVTIQTISHAGTFCEKIETGPYKSIDFPNGYDTIVTSPDKHGNYLTISKCNSGFFCDPSCNGMPEAKPVKIINVGEEGAPMVSDLGTYFIEYAGEDPWSDLNFLDSQGGGAGAIKSKMLKELRPEFIQGQEIDSCSAICDLYHTCFSCADSVYDACILSCDTVQPDSLGNFSAWYNCPPIPTTGMRFASGQAAFNIFPNPVEEVLYIVIASPIGGSNSMHRPVDVLFINLLGQAFSYHFKEDAELKIRTGELPNGMYLVNIDHRLYGKVIINH